MSQPDEKNGSPVPADPAPETWHAHMQVRHRLSGSTGEVIEVDFEEDLVTVLCGEMELTWRIENTYEVTCVHDDGREHPSDGTLPCPVVEAVKDTYDEEGQRIWWSAWDRATDGHRRHMEQAVTGPGMG